MICKQPKVKVEPELKVVGLPQCAEGVPGPQGPKYPGDTEHDPSQDCEFEELCKDEPMCEAQCSFSEKKENEEPIMFPPARVKVIFHSSCDYDNTMVDIRCDERFEDINNTFNFYQKTIIQVIDYIKRFIRDIYGSHIDIKYIASPEVKHRLKEVSYVSGTSAYDVLAANGIEL